MDHPPECSLASAVLLVMLVLRGSGGGGPGALGASAARFAASLARDRAVLAPLFASALIGVVIGDLAWLAALRRLGARAVILTDCLK